MIAEIREETITELFREPSMASSVLMGWHLDDFQSAALKLDWYFPWTIDLSGTSSGKTLRMFVLLNLRCMLLEDHVGAAYFPTWGSTGQKEFWPYFNRTIERHPFYARQLAIKRRKLGEEKGPSCWSMRFKNGSVIDMPAPNFLNDAESQAGRRFNTMIVDEFLKIAAKSKGIESELIGRVTRPSLNQKHPWLCNHVHLKGHAEAPSHPGYVQVDGYKKLIRDGSSRHAIYSFCFKDISAARAGEIREDENIRTQKATLPPADFARNLLGLSDRDGTTYYPDTVLLKGASRDIAPESRRTCDAHYILGFDMAPGQSLKADWAAAKILRLRQIPPIELSIRMAADIMPRLVRVGNRVWEMAFVWAWKGHNIGAMDAAALIQTWHKLFHFSKCVLDPNGGGLLVYKELIKPRVELNGHSWSVTPLCTKWEPTQHDKRAIVTWFARGNGRGTGPGEFNDLPHVGPQYLTGDDGLLAATHLQYSRRWHSGEIGWPMPRKHRDPAEVDGWGPERRAAQERIEEGIAQLTAVRQLIGKDGTPAISHRGFNMFGSSKKKDIAYCGLYAEAGAELILHGMAGDGDDDGEPYA